MNFNVNCFNLWFFFVSMHQLFCRIPEKIEHHHAWVHRLNVGEIRGEESSKYPTIQQRLVSQRRKFSWAKRIPLTSKHVKPECLQILSELCTYTVTWSTFCSTWTAAGMSGCEESESRRIAFRSIVLTNMRGHAARLISISKNGNGGTIQCESSK